MARRRTGPGAAVGDRRDHLVRAPRRAPRGLPQAGRPAPHRPGRPAGGQRGDDPPLGEGHRAALGRAAGPAHRADGPRDADWPALADDPTPTCRRWPAACATSARAVASPRPRPSRLLDVPAGHLRRLGDGPHHARRAAFFERWPSSSGSPSATSPRCAPPRSSSTPPAGRRSASSSAPGARSCGLTRAELAAAVGVSQRTVVAWELGYRVPGLEAAAAAGRGPVGRHRLAGGGAARAGRRPPTLGELILARQRELGLRSADVARLDRHHRGHRQPWVNGRSRPATGNLRRLAGGARQVPLRRRSSLPRAAA